MIESKSYVKSIEIDKDYWLRRAERLAKMAGLGFKKRRRSKNSRAILASDFLINNPRLHIEDDIRLYIEAARAFHISGKWIDASESYAKAAWLKGDRLECFSEAAALYTLAGDCSERINIGSGEEQYKLAISFYCDDSKYNQAGRISFWIAENSIKAGNLKTAISNFQKASKYFEAQNMDYQSINCLCKMADLMGLEGQYLEASETFALIGKKQLEHNLIKYNAQDSFFKSILLLLAIGITQIDCAKQKMKDFTHDYCSFGSSRESDFLNNIIIVLENGNIHDFADHVYDYDCVCPFDQLSLILLECMPKIFSKLN